MTINAPPKRLVEDQVFVLVTGANSQNDHRSLTVIFTTRSSKKGNDTLKRLQDHLHTSATDPSAVTRVAFVPESVDLSDLLSVRALSRRLNKTFPKLDAIVLNAGIGGWTGINWPQAIWGVLTDLVHEVSWPSFKLAPAGAITETQTKGAADTEPRLGSVFCANVFGHYMLAHNVMPLLRHQANGTTNGPGRIIWVSSLEATINHFDINDLQGLRTLAPYESSKALTDILSLTADLPSAAPFVKTFYSVNGDSDGDDNGDSENATTTPAPTNQPNIYLSHPGICGTGILPLSPPLFYAMMAAFWLARLLGSPWHTISTYLGACAPVWLALSTQSTLDAAEAEYRRHGGGRVKWGSSCTIRGTNKPASTEIDGWGHGGVVGSAVVEGDRGRRRKRGAIDLTAERREYFEDLGRKCWQEMEELRVQWDRILDREEQEEKEGASRVSVNS